MNIFSPCLILVFFGLLDLNNFTDTLCISLYSTIIVAYLSDPVLVSISLQVWINMLLIGSLQSDVYVSRSVWVLLYCVSLGFCFVFKKLFLCLLSEHVCLCASFPCISH